ncbi:MAG: hypothetical protein AAFU71_03385 [Cyanobacteria bacterium J06632_22]
MNNLSRLTAFTTLLSATVIGAAPAQAQQPTEALVLGAAFGDRACVMALSSGETAVETFATFEVCEQDLVGQRATLTYDTVNIQAASCQGDPECSETEAVVAVTAAVPIAPPRVATINSATSGDRACYVNLTDQAGESYTLFALFEICEQDIVNQTVQLDYDFQNINAYICQGNLECGLSERALLISKANVVTAPPPQVSIEDLPDGNYRYWSQTSINAIVSDDELLLNPESRLFLFSKQGNNIVGTWRYIDGEAICIEGQLNRDNVTGIGVQTIAGATVISGDNTFAPFGAASRLFVRQGRQVSDEIVRYGTVLLINLNELNRINAGTVLPPSGC